MRRTDFTASLITETLTFRRHLYFRHVVLSAECLFVTLSVRQISVGELSFGKISFGKTSGHRLSSRFSTWRICSHEQRKSNLIGWRQTLTTSLANHIHFLLVEFKLREFKLRVQTSNDKRRAKTNFTLKGSKV